jgi:non-ribosomal peptide synthetase component E (peptide arylation enzyme)
LAFLRWLLVKQGGITVKINEIQGFLTQEMIDDFVRKGVWEPGLLFWKWWDKNAKEYPDKEAIVDARSRLTWAEARERSVQLALGFRKLGLNKDDVVMAELPNCSEAQLIQEALERAGIIFFFVATGFRHKEMLHLLQSSGAVAVVVPGQGRFQESFDFLKMIEEIKPDLPKLKHVITVGEAPEGAISLSEIMTMGAGEAISQDYLDGLSFDFDECVGFRATSGSTGMPKICCLGTPGRYAKEFGERWKVTREDVILGIATISTGAGMPAMELGGLKGCKMVMIEKWNPKEGPDMALSLIEKEKVTIACGVPPHVLMIARHPNVSKYDISSLRLFSWAGAPLAKDAIAGIESNLGCRLVPFYGSMDSGWISGCYYDDPLEIRSFTVGKTGAKREYKLIDEKGAEVPQGEVGELTVRGGTGNMGYYKEPELSKATWDSDGWYNTKDLARIDEDGNIRLMGRASDMINRGGQNIFPIEVENILRSHPKVAEICIVPMPDPLLGSRACAYVEPRAGGTFTFDEMIERLEEEKMAKYKRPERLEILDKMPRLPTGKIDKVKLVDDIKKKTAAE